MHIQQSLCPLVCAGALLAQQFAPSTGRQPAEIPPGSWSVIALADCDGDGDQDAVGNDTDGPFAVLRQGPGGTWTTVPLLPNVVSAATWADFDGDGDLDVLIGGRNSSGAVPFGVVRNNGATFTWLLPSSSALSGTVLECHAADVDGDRLPDAVLGVTTGVQFSRNLGNGVFGPPTVVTTLPNARPELFDRDGDGDLDLAVGSASGVRLFDNVQGAFGLIGSFTAVGIDVAAGDLDGDGRSDLVLANGASVDVLWNQPNGWVLSPAIVPAGVLVSEVAVADLDRDSDRDVVVRGATAIDWIRNDGNGGFIRQTGVRHGAPAQVAAWALGNGASRGATDIVAVFDDGKVRTLYGAAPQPFLDPQALPPLPYQPGAFTVGDFDNDGRQDLVAPRAREIVRNEGRGRYSRRPIVGAREHCQRACTGDFDGDGDLDLLLGTTTLPIPPVPPLQRLANDGFGNFTPVQDVAVPWQYQQFHAGDVDGDGDIDVLAPLGSQIHLLSNAGNGTLTFVGQVPSVPVMDIVNDLVVADLDGDGDLDLAGGQVGSTVPVYQNHGFGTFSVGGVLQLTPGTHATSLAAGDLDGDGDADFAVVASGALAWYRNLGSNSFVRVDGSLPGNGFSSISMIDIDEDDDLDLWGSGWPHQVFRNDGAGVFVDVTATIAPGIPFPDAFFDADEDGDFDLLATVDTSGFVFVRIENRMRAAASAHAVRPGGSMLVRFFAQPDAPDPNTLVLSIAALSPGPAVTIPGHKGKLLLPLGELVPLSLVLAPTGTTSTGLAVPPGPSLIGLEVCVQGVVVTTTSYGFTNVVDERILP